MRALVCIALVSFASLGALRTAAQDVCDDDALSEAAAELSLRSTLDATSLLPAAHRHGSDAPVVHARIERGEDTSGRVAWLARLRRRHEAAMVCGEAQAEGRRVVLAAPRAGTLRVLEGETRVAVTLERGFERPILVIADADGELVHLDASGGEVGLPDDLALPARVQLVAEGPSGPRPIAERTIGEDGEEVEEPIAPRGTFPRSGSVAERVARWRASLGRSPLRPNRILDRVAERHAETVCREARVAHSTGGHDPRERLRAEGIDARHVGEVVGRARDESAALEALAESPRHRAALLDRRFTDVGVASTRGAHGERCVVVLLAAWPRVVPH